MLFGYEYATALLCRLLQLSIPNQVTAMFMSIGGASIEMGVRVFFFNLFLNLFLKKGMETNGKRSKKGEWIISLTAGCELLTAVTTWLSNIYLQ